MYSALALDSPQERGVTRRIVPGALGELALSARSRVESGEGAPPDAQASRATLAELCRTQERFHLWGEDLLLNLQLPEEALSLVLDRVSRGDRTLETGCGYSTVAFALARARHTVVSPNRAEHERIRAWCAGRGVPTETVEFIVARSQDALPAMSGSLDFVLIDGAHALPIPLIDWYYTATRLRVGGLLMVDDTHIRSGQILRDFLRAESPRWRVVSELPRTALFEKVGEEVITDEDWWGQPYGATARRIPGDPVWPYLRGRIRLRSRLRAAAGRLHSRLDRGG
jgi:SAM-dependent methyltransferase